MDQRWRTLAYEEAMARLADNNPDDNEAQIFYALAINEALAVNLAENLVDRTYARQLKAAEILERVAEQLPDHPGVAHYLIHSYDYGPLAALGLPAAQRYAALSPAAGHALHMPSHIYSTLGMWHEAITADTASLRGFSIEVRLDKRTTLPLAGLSGERLHAALAGRSGGEAAGAIPRGSQAGRTSTVRCTLASRPPLCATPSSAETGPRRRSCR